MKKFLVLVSILMASLFCTACINNLAIQELNQMGKNYLDKGDYNNAISRFQSSHFHSIYFNPLIQTRFNFDQEWNKCSE